MKRFKIIAVAVILVLLAGCSVQPDPSTGGQKMVSNCAVCRAVWTAAGWRMMRD